MHRRVRRTDIADRDVGPIGQPTPVFPGIVEQGREHHRRQLDRHALDPVEGLVPRQAFKYPDRPLADPCFHLGEVGWRDDRADDLALFVMLAGGSMRMKLSRSSPFGGSSTAMPPSSDE